MAYADAITMTAIGPAVSSSAIVGIAVVALVTPSTSTNWTAHSSTGPQLRDIRRNFIVPPYFIDEVIDEV